MWLIVGQRLTCLPTIVGLPPTRKTYITIVGLRPTRKTYITIVGPRPMIKAYTTYLPTYNRSVQQAPYSADLPWNRVSNLEPSGPKAETLPLGHRGLSIPWKNQRVWGLLQVKSYVVAKRPPSGLVHVHNTHSALDYPIGMKPGNRTEGAGVVRKFGEGVPAQVLSSSPDLTPP
ncbi:hypothetical protein AVEN_130587-1 [Araneus ventricosus]|uniref:Uncharacterized protein n=1 Tax=Araneus ventricosus TaxID=182803 RepID=A0A4Y2HIU6_ARAVE|nr:hypothetical protein AVEN_130587-1 [Araneus ventricosus]